MVLGVVIAGRDEMLKNRWAFLFMAFGALTMLGCQEATGPQPAQGETVRPALCGGCGHVKRSDACCPSDATTCENCGLVAGSPGCCKITKGTDAELCGGCGQIKGSDLCCDSDAEKCGDCGLAKDSPGCCKIKA